MYEKKGAILPVPQLRVRGELGIPQVFLISATRRPACLAPHQFQWNMAPGLDLHFLGFTEIFVIVSFPPLQLLEVL